MILVRVRMVRVIPLRGLSRTGDHKNKEHKCSYFYILVRVREKISLGLTPNKTKNNNY